MAEGVVALGEVLVFVRVEKLWLGVNDRRRDAIRLPDALDLDVLGETLGRELGAVLRFIWGIDREGLLIRGLTCRLGVVERDEMELRLLRVGMDRCGVGRLGAERVACRMLWRPA
jgi:hypothetical protein